MQVVIEILEEDYKKFGHEYREENLISKRTNNIILNAFCNGIPLPKGHGRLIDADDAKREWQNVLDCEVEHPRYQCTIRDVLEDAPTIIEADKE